MHSRRLWPQSLKGQVLLTMALALLLAQTVSAVLIYRAQASLRQDALIHTAAIRLVTASQRQEAGAETPGASLKPPPNRRKHERQRVFDGPRGFRVEEAAQSPIQPGDLELSHDEQELQEIFAAQDMTIAKSLILRRAVARDPMAQQQIANRTALFQHDPQIHSDYVLIAAVQRQVGGPWLVARALETPYQKGLLLSLIGQTLLIYLVLFGAMALVLRQITQPLASLTRRMERFAETRDSSGQLTPKGPDDLRRLIAAHNAMEARIVALLDEKDVMLGAIGHDLKTPLAGLRVRIESIADDAERGKMAATIEEIVRVLDDILSLARVGRPTDPLESVELGALLGALVEEYEDLGEPVTLQQSQRIVAPSRAVWLRRALRNLIGNGLRYGQIVRVSLSQEEPKWAVIRIEDDGPGIPESAIAAMMEPFTRGDPSRNSETGGSGLGLTLARATADQHGGTLRLSNRRADDGTISGLTAELRLPL